MGRKAHRLAGAISAAVVCLLAGAAGAAAQDTPYTWTGGGSQPNWSDPANWQQGAAPASPAGVLTFPSGSADYQSEDDIDGLSADGLSVDDGDGYLLSGDPLQLGGEGVATTPGASGADAFLTLPLSLTAPQSWSIDGPGGLDLLGGVTQAAGTTDQLMVDFASGGFLGVHSPLDADQLTVTGPGTLALEPGGSIGSPATLDGSDLAAPVGSSSIGSLSAQDSRLTIGQGATPDATLALGALTLDPQSTTTLFVDQNGDTAGADHSQLTVDGPATLNGTLNLVAGLDGSGDCAASSLNPGDTITLIQAGSGGVVSGTFANAPASNSVITLGSVCGGSGPQAEIEYTGTAVTATILSSSASTTTTSTTTTTATVTTTAPVTTATTAPGPSPQTQTSTPPAAASATTQAARGIGQTRATLYGTISTGGAAIQWQFRYGRQATYGEATPLESIPAGSGAVSVSSTVTRLSPRTGYHYELVVYEPIVNAAFPTTEVFNGPDQTFATQADGRLTLEGRNLTVHAGRVLIPQRCQSRAICAGRVRVTTRVRQHGASRIVTCATSAVRIRPGRRLTLAAGLAGPCRQLLAKAPGHRLGAMFASQPETQLGVSARVSLIG